MLEIWHGHLFLFVKLGQAAFRLVGTASHLVVIATDSSNVHSQPLNSYHCHPFKQCAHPATHSVGTAKPSNNVRIQRRTQLALPNTQTMCASSDALSWHCQTFNVRIQRRAQLALPNQTMCASSDALSWHCQTFKQCAHPATYSVGTAKHSNNVGIQRRTQLALLNLHTMCPSSDALSWRCQTLNVHSQKFNRMALPSNPIAQPATQSFSIAIQSDHVQFDQQSFAKHSVGWH